MHLTLIRTEADIPDALARRELTPPDWDGHGPNPCLAAYLGGATTIRGYLLRLYDAAKLWPAHAPALLAAARGLKLMLETAGR